MEKVKIFSVGNSDNFRKLEKAINNWLKKNEKIEIISRKMSCCAGTNILIEGFINVTVVIFYKQKK